MALPETLDTDKQIAIMPSLGKISPNSLLNSKARRYHAVHRIGSDSEVR